MPAFLSSAPPEDPDRRRVRVTGTPDWNRHVLVGGKYLGSIPGFDLLVPVHAGGAAVLVDLGWVPGDGFEEVVEAEKAQGASRTFEGLARVLPEDPHAAGVYPAEPDGFQRFWGRMSPQAMGQGVDLAAYVLFEGEALAEQGRNPDTSPPIGGWLATIPERPHGEYAATWFSILVMLVALWGYGALVPVEPPTQA